MNHAIAIYLTLVLVMSLATFFAYGRDKGQAATGGRQAFRLAAILHGSLADAVGQTIAKNGSSIMHGSGRMQPDQSNGMNHDL